MPSTNKRFRENRNKTLVKLFLDEIFNKHDLSSMEKYFDKHPTESSPHAGMAGKGFKQFLTKFLKAFPDWHATVGHMIAEDNLVTAFLNGSGTHKGEFRGIEPTNKKVNIRSADLYRIEKGIVTGHWDVVDQMNLLKQTGVLLIEAPDKDINDIGRGIDS